MGYPAYPEYKESGIEWLGKVPAAWEVRRLKFVASHNDEALSENTDGQYEIEYVDISSVDLMQGITSTESMPFEKAPSRARRVVKHGDTLVSTVRTYLKGIATINNPPDNLIASTGFAVIRASDEIDAGFLAYYLQSQGFVDAVVANSTGVSYPAINASDLVCLPATYPTDKKEQAKIAQFLDYKTAQTDRLIEKKQELIEKLQEQRIAAITHAVTKGLDSKRSMKDSGIERLGVVPAHWKVLRLKDALVFQRGHDLPSDSREDGSVPLVSSAGISATHSQAIGKAPGIVTGRYGTIGSFTYLEEDFWPLNTTLYSIDLKGNSAKFLWYMLQSMAPIFVLNSKKSAVPGIDRNDLHPEPTVIPPHEEQVEISQYLDKISEKLDAQLNSIQLTIDFYQEYRTALITAAVTGQIDVRDWRAPEPRQEPEADKDVA